jgi:two-component sensor histidine kinase
MLALAFAEIVTNAMKYAHPTGLPVEIGIALGSDTDGALVLQIADDGVGLPEDFVETRDAGVGLQLVRSMVEYAGGRLEIRSDPLGVTFCIHIPRSAKCPAKPQRTAAVEMTTRR